MSEINKELLDEFIEKVEAAEKENKPTVTFFTVVATEAKNYLKTARDARRKGGKKSIRPPIKTDKKSIANRERVRKSRAKKKAE